MSAEESDRQELARLQRLSGEKGLSEKQRARMAVLSLAKAMEGSDILDPKLQQIIDKKPPRRSRSRSQQRPRPAPPTRRKEKERLRVGAGQARARRVAPTGPIGSIPEKRASYIRNMEQSLGQLHRKSAMLDSHWKLVKQSPKYKAFHKGTRLIKAKDPQNPDYIEFRKKLETYTNEMEETRSKIASTQTTLAAQKAEAAAAAHAAKPATPALVERVTPPARTPATPASKKEARERLIQEASDDSENTVEQPPRAVLSNTGLESTDESTATRGLGCR